MKQTNNTFAVSSLKLGALIAAMLLAACSKQSEAPAVTETQASSSVAAVAGFDFNGVWQATSGETLKPLTGSVPFTDAAAKEYAATQALIAKGDKKSWDSTQRCIPPALPRLLGMAQPFDVIVDQHMVGMTFQVQRLVRFIYLDKTYPTNSDASYLGESHGRWEGKELVVETGKFKTGMVLDATGIPHSDKLQITERYEMTAPDTVVDHVTITDAEVFTQPWQTDIVLKKQSGVQVQEDVCVERQGIHK
ncbi:MAG: hypothetical protein QM808_09330 [Steroidobacteraceae bacterium]